eukprot:3134533-Amphidinium_carterae.1
MEQCNGHTPARARSWEVLVKWVLSCCERSLGFPFLARSCHTCCHTTACPSLHPLWWVVSSPSSSLRAHNLERNVR